jgi:4-carboxymuconolactone decarboxylase
MSRIRPIEAPFDPEVSEDLTKLMPPGVPPLLLFRTLAHNPRVLRRVRKGGLLDRGSISVRQRELVILRTTALCGSEYEWGVHVAFFGAAAGLTEAEIAATVSGDLAAFPAEDRLLIELCDALHAAAAVSDALWQRLADAYRPEQLVELVALAGQYHMVSYIANAFGVALEDRAARFPPLG